ncbi:MAG: hypothetical protein CMN56_05225 [Sneathiella sp.]|uniref:hypothetical protein n=1 Tax=Sneathiella sp. TaxID=1964365 RepID=UPI000C3513FE|nr:hypothetical protein [Sneathiella sp.]MAZ02521.1 hypothetical protein [Sneathiella sp.]
MDIFTLPEQVALDATGVPLAGAKLEFYRAGTSTPEDTYTTAARSVAHANPVVADSQGRFPAIYLGTSYNYKAILKTSADVIRDTQDNIPGAAFDGALIKAGTVATAALAAKAVTFDKMADLAQGSVIVGGASNRPATLDISTNGKFLKGNGTTGEMVTLPYPPEFKTGCVVTIGTDTDHDLDITAGYLRDSTNSVNITVAAMTKRGDAAWAAGTGNGMMLTGTIAGDTNYALYVIAKADGTQDFGLHTSLTDPSADLPADYVYYRKIKQVRTDSSANLLQVPVEAGGYNEITYPDQTITAAGTLSLDHALGTADVEIYLSLVCQTNEYNYTAGDVVPIHNSVVGDSGTNGGTNIKVTSSNLSLKYNNTSTTFSIHNFSTGAANAGLTNASWKLRIKVRAAIQ